MFNMRIRVQALWSIHVRHNNLVTLFIIDAQQCVRNIIAVLLLQLIAYFSLEKNYVNVVSRQLLRSKNVFLDYERSDKCIGFTTTCVYFFYFLQVHDKIRFSLFYSLVGILCTHCAQFIDTAAIGCIYVYLHIYNNNYTLISNFF